MPDLLIEDPRSGQKVSPYIGGDPQTPPAAETPPAAADRGDASTSTQEPNSNDNKNPQGDAAGAAKTGDEPAKQPGAADPAAKGGEPSNEGAQERDDKGRFIPKARFDEVNERRKAAEKKLADREAQDAAAANAAKKNYDFDKAEKEYADLLLDGKIDDALAKRKEIRAAEQEMFRASAQTVADTSARAVTTKEKIDSIAADYESKYPVFDPNSDQFSEDVCDDLQALYGGYLNSGKFASPDVAFKAALDKTIQMHGAKPREEKPAPSQQQQQTPPARTAQTRVEAIVNQPPLIGKQGTGNVTNGDGQYKPTEMTEAELMKLPEATRRRLRGDDL